MKKRYGIEYKDWAYGEWFFAGEIWAASASEAENKARAKYGNKGKGYRAYLISANSARKNPTKAQKREKAKKASVQRRVAVALAKFLKQANPAMKTAGAMVTKLKGGGFNIRPIKAVKRGRR